MSKRSCEDRDSRPQPPNQRDMFFAANPIVVAAVTEAYWLGAEGLGALSWWHRAVAALWSAFALTDFFATDITNQRLRSQFNVGDGT